MMKKSRWLKAQTTVDPKIRDIVNIIRKKCGLAQLAPDGELIARDGSASQLPIRQTKSCDRL